MPYYFTPPVRDNIPNTDQDPVARMKNPNGSNLGRHFASPGQAVNVWVKTDGTITEAQPWPLSDVARVYYGAHDYAVTAAEKAALEAAGYTVTTS